MTETVQGNGSADRDNDFWRAHVLAARDFIGTDAEYCRRFRFGERCHVESSVS